MSSTADEEEKSRAVHHRYALEHWKATCKEDDLYCPPVVHADGLPTLNELMAGEERTSSVFGVLSEGLVDDSTMSLLEDEKTSVGQCPVHCFRMLHFNPARLKVAKTPMLHIRSDHIAIAPYQVTARRSDETGFQIAVASRVSLDAAAPVRFLSLDHLLNIEVVDLRKNFNQCGLAKAIGYHFSGVSMPDIAMGATARMLITKFTNAEAFPGPNLSLILATAELNDEVTSILKSSMDENLMR